MRKLTFVFVSLSLVFVGVSACSSDSSSPATGTGGSAGSSAAGKCDNAADKPTMEGTVDGGTVSGFAGKCAVSCLGKADPCVEDCVVAATGISHLCASCVAASADCSKKQCLSECVADPSAVKCQICQCGLQAGKPINCLDAYEKCSGLPNTVCGNIPDSGAEDAPAETSDEAAVEAGEDVSADVAAE